MKTVMESCFVRHKLLKTSGSDAKLIFSSDSFSWPSFDGKEGAEDEEDEDDDEGAEEEEEEEEEEGFFCEPKT